MQKRVWEVGFLSGVSLDKYIIDKCAICSGNLSSLCCDCLPDSKEFKDYAKYVFILLHVLRKRRDSIFYGIDKNVLEKIIRYSLITDLTETDCFVVQAECNHIFHTHCINKWLKKRPNCPLCNMNFKSICTSSTKRHPFVVYLRIMTENQIFRREKRLKLFEQEREEENCLKFECERIENVIRDTLKHNKFGFCYEDLLGMTTDFFKNDKIEQGYFDLALERTMEKKYVYLIEGVYVHVIHTEYY